MCGFLGNWFKVPLFFNVDFLFGSVFSMLAIAVLGRTCGVITGFAAGTCTYFLWNHPWSVIIFTVEAAVVSLLYDKRKGSLVIWDLVYWGCIGMPLVYLFYHHAMGVPLQGTLVVMLKQAVNGVSNALLAMLVLILFKYLNKSAGSRTAYSELLFTVMLAFALLPTILLSVSAIRAYQENRMESLKSRVSWVAEAARSRLSGWIYRRHDNVRILSGLVGDPNTNPFSEVQHCVETVKAATPGFKGMGVFNDRSVSVAYSPPEQDGRSNIGVDMSARTHIGIMRKDKNPYITDVLLSKLGTPTPIVILLAPVIISGQYKGYCSGVVETALVSGILDNLKEPGIHITLVDGQDRVIVSTLPEFKTMDRFVRPYYPAGGEGTGYEAVLWKPEAGSNTSLMQQWQSAFLFSSASVSENCRWRVVVEASLLPVAGDISRYSLIWLALQGLLISAAIGFSLLLSRGFIANIRKLQVLTRSVPQRLDDADRIEWPRSAVEELAELSTNFQQMTSELVKYITDQKMIEEALRQREEDFAALVEHAPDVISLFDRNLRRIYVNAGIRENTGLDPSFMIGKSLAEAGYPDSFAMPLNAALRKVFETGIKETVELDYEAPKGRIWLEIRCAPVRDADGSVLRVITIGRNITDRKNAEMELYHSHREKTALLKEVHHRVKNNLQIVASLLSLQAGRSDSPQAVEAIEDIRGRVKSMALLHETLYRSESLARIDVAGYLKELCSQILNSSGPAAGRVKLEFQVAPVGMPLEPALPCGLIVNELVTNALKHGFPEGRTGRIVVGLEAAGEKSLALRVRDDGAGLPPHFNPESTGTLGMQLVTGLVSQLDGQLQMERPKGGGVSFCVVFPLPVDTIVGGES